MPYEPLELNTAAPILSWANHELGSQEYKMAKNMASLPFVFKHIALMPDVHLGKGALVGSVIATKEAIIPAAVGVDIGCFTGETLVTLVDGKSYPIKELAEKNQEILVYSCTETGKIVAAKATAKLTRKNASLVKVILDNGAEIRCTPDHQFMLRDGSYQEAMDLKNGTSLMPFYSHQDKDGYTLIQQNYSGQWEHNDLILAEMGLIKFVKNYLVEQKLVTYNHQVIAVIPLTEVEDVYCLNVPEYHNFALTAGVFVHNCGMMAIKTPFMGEQLDGKLKQIRLDIEDAIPVGFDENKEIEKTVTNWQGWSDFKDLHKAVQHLEKKAMKQLGSLGGGKRLPRLTVM